jgi:hypothetical protein
VLHPNLAEVYRERVAALESAPAHRKAPDVLEAARALSDRVVVHPPEDPGGPPGIELVGQLLTMLQAGDVRLTTEDQALAASVLRSFASSAKAGSGGPRPPRVTHRVTNSLRR